MKMSKTKSHLVLRPETGNDCFTCGVIAAMQPVSIEMADYGVRSISIPDHVIVSALCSGKPCLSKGEISDGRKVKVDKIP